MRELKACPFCGSKATVGLFLVGCHDCKITFHFNPQNKESLDSTIVKWNSRISDD
jgi:transposase-like protein